MANRITWTRRDSIAELDSKINANLNKYQYNVCRYTNRPDMDLRNAYEYSRWYGSFASFKQDDDLIDPAHINVIKSVIDSIVSKLSNNKTRPFFSPVNGTYKTRKVVQQAQVFFDQTFDALNLHDTVSEAFRDACICDIGHILIDPFTYDIGVVKPWMYATLSSEGLKPTKCLIEEYNVPIMRLNKYGLNLNKSLKYVNFAMYIDTLSKEAVIFVNERPMKTIKYDFDRLPVVDVYFNKPVLGTKTTSIADDLESIQCNIDLINAKMSASTQLTPATTTYIYQGTSNLKKSDLNTAEGNVYEIDMMPGMTQLPVQTVRQPPFDPGLQQALDYYINKAYDMIGISQLSAQSKKPSGLDSGVALQTMEDIESDRFETQVSQYTKAYVDLTKLMIEILPDDLDILPPTHMKNTYKWKDVKEQSQLFKVQYSAASALSKDPAERLKQILQLTQVNLIDASQVSQYLDLPDLTEAYAGASAISDAIDACINGAIENEVYKIPDYINYQQLSQRIALVENQLYASITREDAKNDDEVITSLAHVMALEEVLNAKMEEEGFIDTTGQQNTAVSDSGLAVGNANNATQAVSTADAMSQALPNVEQQIESNSANGEGVA